MNKATIRFIYMVLLLALVTQTNVGCASFAKKFKAFLNGKSYNETAEAEDVKIATPRFSETDSMPYNSDRRYRRMTKDRFVEEAEVRPEAGSLWVMEGQGAYLFAQNTTRLVGDILNVRIDGNPKSQLQTKTRVISKLLNRLEGSDSPAVRAPASAPTQPGGQEQQNQPPGAGQQAGAQQPQNTVSAAGATPAAPSEKTDPQSPFSVEKVPTRIVEVMKDGSYRVRGSQEFMIGKREYKVIVTGIVRPEDFNEEGIEAEKLLDSQFDIVSNRRGASL